MRPTKYDLLVEQLESEINRHELAPGKKIYSQSQLVNRFQVSRSCVNKALGLLQRRGMITAIPGKGNFVSLKTVRSFCLKSLIYLVDSATRTYMNGYDDFGTEIIWAIEQVCKENKVTFIMRSVAPDEFSQLADIVRDSGADGVIISPRVREEYNISEEHIVRIAATGIPTVYCDHPAVHPQIGCSMINYLDSLKSIVGRLLAANYRRIAVFYPGTSRYGMEISNAVMSIRNIYPGASIYDIDFSRPGVIYDQNIDMDQIAAAVSQARKDGNLPDVFICNTDHIAAKLLTALKSVKLRIPEDVQVIGALNLEFGKSVEPALSTMAVKSEMLGRKAFEIVRDMALKGEPPRVERVPMTYVRRRSCLLTD